MSTAYYTQPAAPHRHSSKARGYRLCDACGAAENPAVNKFRLCGGCMATQYCSSDCQKSNWTDHKAICQHTTNTVAAVKQSAAPLANEMIAKELRKFSSHHNTLLSWAGYHGLHIMRHPENIRDQALLIELKPKNSNDPSRRFTVRATHIVPRSYITDQDPLVADDVRRRDDRSRRTGGLGTALVVAQCGGVNQVIPVECDRVAWSLQKDWASVLHHCVENGITDFRVSSQGLFQG